MGTKTERKESSREKILDSAGCLLREKGIAGTSVASVMGGAGMTVGGFYAHFPSKQELIAETLRRTVRASTDALEATAEGKHGTDRVNSIARVYLSRWHRDNPTAGCPLPASAGEIASADLQVRQALAEELRDLAGRLESHLDEGMPDGQAREEALAAMALMVGGLTLARATEGTEMSDEVLKACRDHIERCLAGASEGENSA